MPRTLDEPLTALRAALGGAVLTAEDDGYEQARRVWNATVDAHPAVIVRCESEDDVVTALSFARSAGLEVAVRGGGHSVSGESTVDGGLVIDLRAMNAVLVDPEAGTARVGGGALLKDLDTATQAHGLAVPSGIASDTGVGGLTLGGGMGYLTRFAGLTIDNLVSARVVLADGSILRASADAHADLFWALRGGGGNFGVVTEFTFRLHRVGPLVHTAVLFWGIDQGRAVLHLVESVLRGLPRELNIMVLGMAAPPAPFVPPEHRGTLGIALRVIGVGSREDHAALLGRIRDALPPLWESAGSLPYVALQAALDEPDPSVRTYDYFRSVYVDELSDEVIDVVLDQLPRKPSALSMVAFYRLDGAFSAVGDDETAFGGGRSPGYAVFPMGECLSAEGFAAERRWARAFGDALAPVARGGTYVNVLSDEPGDRVEAAYGRQKYHRLAEVKAAYDPGNLFHRNPNIRPAVPV